jgi:hypothetical protein
VSADIAAGFLARARDDAAAVLPIADLTDAIVGSMLMSGRGAIDQRSSCRR